MIKFYIQTSTGWERLDQSEHIQYTLNKTLENLSNPADYVSDYSKTITVPMTTHNNQIFNHIYRLDSDVTTKSAKYPAGFDPTKKINFYLCQDEAIIVKGYFKMMAIHNSLDNKCYELTLYGKLGDTLGTLMELTFNELNDDENNIISNPLSNNLKLDRFLVSDSWDNEHPQLNIEGCRDVDIIGFAPDEHGLNGGFDSTKQTSGPSVKDIGDVIDERTHTTFGSDAVGDGLTERQMSQFRSYYEKPYVYINKLWQIFQRESEERCDYKLNLDKSWFSAANPYYTDTVYMLPDVFNADTTTGNDTFTLGDAEVTRGFPSDGDTTGINVISWENIPFNTQDQHYDPITHIIRTNPNEDVLMRFKYKNTIHAADKTGMLLECKLSDSNALITTIRCISAASGATLTSYKVMVKSSTSTLSESGYNKVVKIGNSPDGGSGFGAHWYINFDMNLKISKEVAEDFIIKVDSHWLNTHNPFRGRMVASAGVWFDFYWEGSNWSKVELLDSKFNMSSTTRSGMPITMGSLFPTDIAPFKVLIDYCKMFGLMMEVDDTNKSINVLTRYRYFENYSITDWSSKLDRTQEFSLKPVAFSTKYINFSHEDSNDENAKNYKDKYEVSYGGYRIKTDYEFDSDTTEIVGGFKTSINVSRKMATLQNLLASLNSQSISANAYAHEHNEIYASNISKNASANVWGNIYFRLPNQTIDPILNPTEQIVYITDDDALQLLTDTYCYTTDQSVMIEKTSIPTLSTMNGDYTIHYKAPYEYYSRNIDESGANDIYNSCLREFIDERYSKTNKMLTAYFYITPAEFMNFHHKKFVMIDNVIYIVNRIIDYNPNEKKTTKCELVQITNEDAYRSGLVFHWLNVNPQVVELPATDGNFTLDIDSDSPYTLSTSQIWIRATNNILYFQANTSTIARRALVNVTSGELSVTVFVVQNGNNERLVISPNTLTFSQLGGTQQVIVYSSSQNITATPSASWITAIPSLSQAGVICSITVSTNQAIFSRNAVVTFSDGINYVDLTVSQQGNIRSTDTDFELNNIGGNIIITTPKKIVGVIPPTATSSDGQEIVTNTLNVSKSDVIQSGGKVEISVNSTELDNFVDAHGGGVIQLECSDGSTIDVQISK